MSDNLFYTLYSKNTANKYASAGYTCSTATNEADVNFNISGGKGNISDSNGDTLSSIDFSKISATGLTQYSTETKVLQANTCYLIQGPEYGLQYGAQYFRICKDLEDVADYDDYCNAEFDLNFSQDFASKSVHIDTSVYRAKLSTYTSVWTLVQNIFDELKVPIAVSQETKTEGDSSTHDFKYIKFLSNKIGYPFQIANLRLIPIYASEDCPDSPFVHSHIIIQNIIDAIIEVRPIPWLDSSVYTFISVDSSTERHVVDIVNSSTKIIINTSTDTSQYFIDCSLYEYVIGRLEESLVTVKSTEASIYTVDTSVYVVDSSIFFFYNYNPEDVRKIYQTIIDDTGLSDIEDDSSVIHKIYENLDYRIPYIKYPNGAMRGIVLVPTYPLNYDSNVFSLQLNHIQDKIAYYNPVEYVINSSYEYDVSSNDVSDLWHTTEDDMNTPKVTDKILYQKFIFRVLSELRLQQEFDNSDMPCTCKTLGCGTVTQNTEEQWINGTSPYDVYEEFIKSNGSCGCCDSSVVWVDPSHGPDPNVVQTPDEINTDYVGMYTYLKWVNDNNLWTKFGQFYGIVSESDVDNSSIKNLIPSIFVFNPNAFPVKVNLMMFS